MRAIILRQDTYNKLEKIFLNKDVHEHFVFLFVIGQGQTFYNV